jgi:hypothetical protein
VAVGVHAQVVLDLLREVAPQDRRAVLEGGLQPPDHDRQAGEEPDLLHGLRVAEAGQEGFPALDDDVHRHADQERRREVEDLVEDGAEGGEENARAVGTRVAEQAYQHAR